MNIADRVEIEKLAIWLWEQTGKGHAEHHQWQDSWQLAGRNHYRQVALALLAEPLPEEAESRDSMSLEMTEVGWDPHGGFYTRQGGGQKVYRS